MTKVELIQRFKEIFSHTPLFGTLWTDEDQTLINKQLDLLAEELADAALERKTVLPAGAGLDWMIAAPDLTVNQLERHLAKEAQIREVTQAYVQYMGFNPLEWGKLERLQKFLLTKSVEEIKTFAAWSRKEYSTLTPPKARQYPQLVIDCWNLAFEKPTAENNTKSAIQEAIHGRTN